MSKYREVQDRLNQILERADVGDRTSRSIDLFLTVLVIVNIIAITLDSVPQIHTEYKALFEWIEIISVGIFTLEYLCRIWVAPSAVSGPQLCWRLQRACQIHAKLQWPCRSSVRIALLSTRLLPLFRSTNFAGLTLASYSKIVSLQFGYGRSI